VGSEAYLEASDGRMSCKHKQKTLEDLGGGPPHAPTPRTDACLEKRAFIDSRAVRRQESGAKLRPLLAWRPMFARTAAGRACLYFATSAAITTLIGEWRSGA